MRVRDESGFTLIELLMVVAIITIIAAFAIPNMARSRMTVNEASAIQSLKAINQAQMSYYTTAGLGGFADTLPTLGVPCSGSGATQGFLGPDMTSAPSVRKSGYLITLMPATGAGEGPTDCNGKPTKTGYLVTAAPIMPGQTGTRAFATTAAQTVWENTAGAPPTEADMNAAPTNTVHPIQ